VATLGVIVARGGSKRFPGKNLAPFNGRPLIAWTILAAQHSRIDTLICSTDDEDINLTALAYGCRTLRRPDELATDTAKCEDALRHALGILPHDYVVLLQPTSPLRSAEDINNCVRISTNRQQAVVTYCGGELNGAVYVAPSEWILKNDFTAPHVPYVMPWERSLDINYQTDIDAFLSRHRPP